MDQRARMYRTLGCLAGAMTGTATLLAWINPSPVLPEEPVRGQIDSLARALVLDRVELRPGQWRDVEILARPTAANAAVMLAAGVDPPEFHFYIDRDGRPSRADRWRHQLPPSNSPHTIRIQVATVGNRPRVSSVQWETVQGLLEAIHDAVAPHRAPLPVHLSAELSQARVLPTSPLLATPSGHHGSR